MIAELASLFDKVPPLSHETSLLITHPALVSPSHFIIPLLLKDALASSAHVILLATQQHFCHYQSALRKVASGLNLYEEVEKKQTLTYIDLFSAGITGSLEGSLPLTSVYPATYTDAVPNKLISHTVSSPVEIIKTIGKVVEKKSNVLLLSDGILEALHLAGLEWKGVLGFMNEVKAVLKEGGVCWTWNTGILRGEEGKEEDELGWRCVRRIAMEAVDWRLEFKENLGGTSLDVHGAIEMEGVGGVERMLGGGKKEVKYKVGEHGLTVFYRAMV